MNRLFRIALFSMLVVFSQSVIGKESIKLVFIGPTIGNETVLAAEGLEAWSKMLKSSDVVADPSLSKDRLADSYTVDHHIGHGNSTVDINEYRYIPSSSESPGFVYFVNVRGGWASWIGTWYKLQNGADHQLKEMLGI